MSAIILRGLGFGDEGKGTITDFLARTLGVKTVIRDSGGPQAGHRVVDEAAREHVFSQFSSATFQADVKSYLSGDMIFKIPNFFNEARALEKKKIAGAAERVRIDPGCALVTPLHAMLNQIKALARIKNPYGSVGVGVGEAVYDRDQTPDFALYVRDCLNEEILNKKIDRHFEQKFAAAKEIVARNPRNQAIAEIYAENRHWITKKRILEQCAAFRVDCGHLLEKPVDFFGALNSGEPIIFEGAQGALLDPAWGFWPHVTKTCATAKTAKILVDKHLAGKKMVKIGILRAYSTRHGFGPFVCEESNFPARLLDKQKVVHPWQGEFRAGWFDLPAARYGLTANNGIDSLALTNLDRLSAFRKVKVCTAYHYRGKQLGLVDRFFEWTPCTGGARLKAFKPGKTGEDKTGLARILFECEPIKYRIFPGWKLPISHVREFGKLPKEARNYISFLESEEGLDVPVSVISVGERSDQKFLNNPLW